MILKTSSSLLMLKIFNVSSFNFSSDVSVSLSSKGLDKVPSFTLSCSFKVNRKVFSFPFSSPISSPFSNHNTSPSSLIL